MRGDSRVLRLSISGRTSKTTIRYAKRFAKNIDFRRQNVNKLRGILMVYSKNELALDFRLGNLGFSFFVFLHISSLLLLAPVASFGALK